MAERILTWYIDEPKGSTRQGATFCLDQDYEPVCVRVYAAKAPDSGNLVIDINDDGESILTNKVTLQSGQNELDWWEDIDEVVMDKYSFISVDLDSVSGAKQITIQLELTALSEDDEDAEV